MYDVRFKGKAKKKFKNFLQRLSPNVKAKIRNTLYNYPYPSPTHGHTLCKVERKGILYGIEPTGGDRILYDIISEDNKKIVLIHSVGNDDEEIRYLKKYVK